MASWKALMSLRPQGDFGIRRGDEALRGEIEKISHQGASVFIRVKRLLKTAWPVDERSVWVLAQGEPLEYRFLSDTPLVYIPGKNDSFSWMSDGVGYRVWVKSMINPLPASVEVLQAP